MLHDHEAPTGVCIVDAGDHGIPCHCDHTERKDADLLVEFDFEVEGEGSLLDIALVESNLFFRLNKFVGTTRPRAGPPPAYVPSPVLTGKFLI